jgi:hypothetical protein
MIIGSHPILHLQEYAKWVYSTFKMAGKKIAGLAAETVSRSFSCLTALAL